MHRPTIRLVLLAGMLLPLLALLGGCNRPGTTPGAAADPATPTPPAATAPPAAAASAAAGAGSACTLCVEANPLLTVAADGTAAGALRLCNRGAALADLHLLATDFVALRAAQTPYALGAAVTVTPGTPFTLDRNTCAEVKVAASKLWQAGVLRAALTNNGQPLATLVAVRDQVPFHLKVAGPTPERATLSFTRGRAGAIELRNEDPMSYRFVWSFELDGQVLVADQVGWVAPGGMVRLPITLADNAFALMETGFLRAGAKTGQLSLRHEPAAEFGDFNFPTRQYPVDARLNYWGDTVQAVLNGAFVFVLLTLGIVVSLVVNYALPVQRKRIDVRQRLANQEGRLAGLGNVVQSRTLSLLRSEKKRLGADLGALWPIDPATEAELPKLGARIDWLDQRIDLTVKAGQLLEVLRSDAQLAQAEIDAINASCQEVLAMVEKPAPEPEEIKAAQALILAATALQAASRQRPGAAALAALTARQAAPALAFDGSGSGSGSGSDPAQWQAFSDLVAALKLQFLPADTTDTSREAYVAACAAVSKVEAVVAFKRLVCQAGNGGVRDARWQRREDLLKALLPGADESVPRAIQTITQVEQNISTAELLARIKADQGCLWIEVDPPTPIPRQMVMFRLHVRGLGFDVAQARHDVECRWFVDGAELEAEGWRAYHYFEEKAVTAQTWQDHARIRVGGWYASVLRRPRAAGNPFGVSAALRDPAGALLVQVGPQAVALERPKSYGESKTTFALIALLITVIAVGVGLLAGAQEKLQSLGWLPGLGTVLLLGFSADALKRVLTRP